MTDADCYCVHAFISGRVQGVCFRAFTRDQALAAGLSGWAKNLADGRVETLLQGPRDAVEAVLEALNQGPTHAVVTGIESESLPPQSVQGFRIS